MAVVSTNCCMMNMSSSRPPLSTSPSPRQLNSTQLSSRQKIKNEGSWRSQCVAGVACMVITLESGNLICIEARDAIAGENLQAVVQPKEKKIMRWSDERRCAPWRVNSLETIVPENLPRPSARRKWEKVDYSKLNAPAIKVSTETSSSSRCFSM